MMKRPWKVNVLLALCLVMFSVMAPAKESRADVEVTISFAAGGVACGIYFFIYLSTGNLISASYLRDRTALLNLGPEGWKPGIPTLQLAGNKGGSQTPYLNILQYRF